MAGDGSAVSRDMAEIGSLPTIVRIARECMEAGVADHVAGAAGSEATLLRNKMAFDSLAFRPRVLRDVSDVSARAPMLGEEARLPVALAPVGSLHTVVPDGTAEALRGAAAFGVPAFVSSVAQPGMEDVAAAAGGRKALQLYIRQEPVEVEAFVRRAREAGYVAVAVTVDSANYGIRDRQRLGKWQPPAAKRGGREFQRKLTWEMIDALREAALPMPVMLKGIQTGEDAELAVARGIDTLYVSNHGGRQLDHCRSTLDVLREVREAVGPGPTVLLDGGIRRGTDVLKAIASGANGVCVGRLYAWGLAAGGAAGVVRTLELLEEEILNAMALLGVRRLDELDASYVAEVPPLPPVPAGDWI